LVTLRFFGPAREVVGVANVEVTSNSVGELVTWATDRFGSEFARIMGRSRVWVNGEPSEPSRLLVDGDEVAILPPVSGG
jgi:molybdopterin converting factor small subunit